MPCTSGTQAGTSDARPFFERVAELVDEGRALVAAGRDCAFEQRMCRAAHGLRNGSTSPLDWAVLVRQLLRREDEWQWGTGGPPHPHLDQFQPPGRLQVARLTVPDGTGGWPSAEVWGRVQVRARAAGEGRFVLEAEPWEPTWLNGCPARAAEAGVACRSFDPIAGDPLLRRAGYDRYSNAGQREAIRAVLTAPPASTLVANLPTGAGKSLCGQLPALLPTGHSGETPLSIVVVPTTALCIDQEQSLRGRIEGPCAYYSGPEAGVRAEIRSRIFRGEQRIVITSPEALLTSLRPAAYAAAAAGRLAWLVIDEAHVVSSWGDEFRPDFQMLPGLRRDLIRQASAAKRDALRTLLLSATITPQVLSTLQDLFDDPGPFAQVAAVQLRPEPSYWVARCNGRRQKFDRVEEAVLSLPRPLILYVSYKEEARWWHERLREIGFKRVRQVTGETPSADRKKVVEAWRAREVDVIVATSAFGLGMDQADVRSVVHATVPESVDRFYQDVGRGGRDGRASVSLLVYEAEDVAKARDLGQDKLITIEKGRSRWRAMWDGSASDDQGRRIIDVGSAPTFGMKSEANEKWNLRTLSLMARARMLEVDAVPPPPPPRRDAEGDTSAEDQSAYEAAMKLDRARRAVVPQHGGHLDEAVWRDHIEPCRLKEYETTGHEFKRMVEVLEGQMCVSLILEKMYRIGRGSAEGKTGGVTVAGSCGSCPWCRAHGEAPFAEPMPRSRPPWDAAGEVDAGLKSLLHEGCLLLLYPPASRRWREDLERVVPWLIREGVRAVAAAGEEWGEVARVAGGAAAGPLMFDLAEVQGGATLLGTIADRVPSLVIHGVADAAVPRFLYGVREPRHPPRHATRVVLLPDDVQAPGSPGVLLKDKPPTNFRRTGELIAEFGL